MDALAGYLRTRQVATPLRIVFRRGSASEHRFHDYHVRELPGEDIEQVGAWDEKIAAQ